jgi:hypothetical protein
MPLRSKINKLIYIFCFASSISLYAHIFSQASIIEGKNIYVQGEIHDESVNDSIFFDLFLIGIENKNIETVNLYLELPPSQAYFINLFFQNIISRTVFVSNYQFDSYISCRLIEKIKNSTQGKKIQVRGFNYEYSELNITLFFRHFLHAIKFPSVDSILSCTNHLKFLEDTTYLLQNIDQQYRDLIIDIYKSIHKEYSAANFNKLARKGKITSKVLEREKYMANTLACFFSRDSIFSNSFYLIRAGILHVNKQNAAQWGNYKNWDSTISQLRKMNSSINASIVVVAILYDYFSLIDNSFFKKEHNHVYCNLSDLKTYYALSRENLITLIATGENCAYYDFIIVVNQRTL